MLVVGVDPGGSGGMYALKKEARTDNWEPGRSLVMPMVDVGKRVRDVDIKAIVGWFEELAEQYQEPVSLVVLEDVGYMPASATGFGSGYGDSILSGRYNQILGMIKTLDMPRELPKPQTWQSKLGVKVPRVKGEKAVDRKRTIKQTITAFVLNRYPTAVIIAPGCRTIHDGLVDALALAHYGAMKLTGQGS